MNFHTLKINENLRNNLATMVDSRRLPHAIVIDGGHANIRGELAHLLATALVCSSEGERPCMVCSHCIKSKGKSHADVFEVIGGEDSRSFHVDKIREIRRDTHILPNEAQRKVYILQNAQSMSPQAQNALLKILEEPPEYVSFILTCNFKGNLLTTVLSRSTVFNLGQEDASDDDAGDDESQDDAKILAVQIADALIAINEIELMKLTGAFEKDKPLLRRCVAHLVLIFRDALVLRTGAQNCISGNKDTAKRLAGNLTQYQLVSLINTSQRIANLIEKNTNNNLLVTMLCSELRRVAGR